MRRNFFPDLIYNYMYGYFLIISVSSNNFINILCFDFVWMIRMMMMISAGWDLRVWLCPQSARRIWPRVDVSNVSHGTSSPDTGASRPEGLRGRSLASGKPGRNPEPVTLIVTSAEAQGRGSSDRGEENPSKIWPQSQAWLLGEEIVGWWVTVRLSVHRREW